MNKYRKITILSLIALFLLGVTVWIIWGNTALELNAYTIKSGKLPPSFDQFRIAHISDLHNCRIGKDNQRLLEMLKEAQPDIIAITGDLIDSRRTKVDVALNFVAEAVKIAPCYYVPGNHESRVDSYAQLKTGLAALGVTILENEKVTLNLNGSSITLLGVIDPDFYDDGRTDSQIMDNILQDLTATSNGFTVLLSHRPELLDIYSKYSIDLVLSGHAHGGQFRMPFIGGLFAPNQGAFPKYDAGLYTQQGTCMLVSRGIGNSLFPFRFNNRPEIILIELQST